MNVLRALTFFLACASVATAGPPRTFVRVATHPEWHSCALSIVAVDGKPFASPQKEVTFSPGRHHLSIRVWLGRKREGIIHVDAPFDQVFKPHRYWIDGEVSKSGVFTLLVEDEDERPPGAKRQQTK